jgi:hypothetical protein
MDPYLESPAVWPDFHLTFLVSFREVLNAGLPGHYVARLDRYVWVDDSEAETLRVVGKPDAFVSDVVGTTSSPSAAVLTAPATVTLPVVGKKGKPFLRIIDNEAHRVVTVVELLSPTNKKVGKDREAYLLKRQEYLETQVNLVELDLLRSGVRPPVEGSLPPGDYFVIVSTAADRPRAGVWNFTLRDGMPVIPVPLGGDDPPVELALQDAFARAYDSGGYAREIDYAHEPDPPLKAADAAWVREQLRRSK